MKTITRVLGWVCFSLVVGSSAFAQTSVRNQAPTYQANIPIVSPQTVAAQQAAAVPITLNGYWAGVGYLDEEALVKKLSQIGDEETKARIIKQARMFVSTVSVINFNPNGQYESDVEISNEKGETAKETVRGTWRVTESRKDKFLVDILEQRGDQSTATVRMLFQFYEDGVHMASPVETSEDLADLNPLLLYERVPDAVMADK